jgi:hypothetical protein
MAYTGTTYSEMVQALGEVEQQLAQASRRLADSASSVNGAISSMSTLPTTYQGIMPAADALLAAAPSNPELIAMRSRLNLLLADRAALLTKAQAMASALSGA